MHYEWNKILASAEKIGNGWKKSVIVLEDGDSAHSPFSDKWEFRGTGEISYMIHYSSVDVIIGDAIRKVYR